MTQAIKWIRRIGLIGIVVIWLYILFVFLFKEDTHENNIIPSANNDTIINLKAITIGTPPKEGLDIIYEELDKLTIPELGCTLRFEFIPWGDERKQLSIATASGEYDYIPGGVFSDYLTLISKNAFLNLNQYLYQVPDLVQHYKKLDSNALKKSEIQNGLYGLPQCTNLGITNIGSGFFYREDLRKKWGLRPIIDLDSMEAYLYRAKQEEEYRDEPLITDNRIWMALWDLISEGRYFEVSSAMETPFVVIEADNPRIVVNRIDTPEFEKVMLYINKWYRDGIIASDILVASDNEGIRGLNLMLANKKPCETNVPIWSCTTTYIPALYDAHPEWEFQYFDYRLQTARLYLGTITKNSVISISSKTSRPDIAIRLLEKLYTDTRYYNLLHYGVEDIHYRLNDGIIYYDDISPSNYFTGWTAVVDDSLNYKEVSVNPKWQEEVLSFYNTPLLEKEQRVEYNSLINFRLNTMPILKNINKLEVVQKEDFLPVVCGISSDYKESLNQLRQALENAEFEVYREEIELQLKTFLYYAQ